MIRARNILMLLAVAAAVAVTAPAPGAETALAETIEPRVDRRPFTELLERTGTDEDERVVAEMLYGDYLLDLQDLSARARSRIASAGRGRVEDALAGRIFLKPEELRRMRVAVATAEHESWGAAQELAVELLTNLGSVLPDEEQVDFAAALRPLRRAMYLHPRRVREQDETYAGDGVDVVRLVEEARAPGGELEDLDLPDVAGALEVWEQRIDDLLMETAVAEREGRLRLTIARIERDRPRQREEERLALERWRRHDRANRSAVDAVAGLVSEAAGTGAGGQWRDRFDRACFPRFFRPTRPERIAAWITQRDPEGSGVGSADAIVQAFGTQDRALVGQAIALLLRARLAFGTLLHGGTDPTTIDVAGVRELHEELLKVSGRRSRLATDAAERLAGLLSIRQRRQMEADLAAAAYGRR